MRLHALLVPLVALSCRRAATPPSAHADASRPSALDARTPRVDASPDIARDASVSDVLVTVPRWTLPPGHVPRDASTARRTTVARVAPTNANDPMTLVATPAGALLVRAVNHEGQRVSELVATTIDRRGLPVGPPKLLRRTTGPVRALSADARGAHSWIAWHTVRGREDASREEHLVAAMHGNADLSEVDAPQTLRNFSAVSPEVHHATRVWEIPVVQVFAREDGRAMVLTTDDDVTCVTYTANGGEFRGPCPSWSVWVGVSTRMAIIDREAVSCASGVPHAFVRLPQGIGYTQLDDQVSYKSMPFTAGWELARVEMPFQRILPTLDVVAMAWGDGVFAMRAMPYAEDEGVDGVWMQGPAALQGMPAPEPLWMPEPVRFLPQPLRCVQGHPVVRVRWEGGPRDGVVFDPTHEGTSIELVRWADIDPLPLPSTVDHAPTTLVWAGEALVGLAGEALLRWTCAPNGSLRLATP